jgi:hypothetical protein
MYVNLGGRDDLKYRFKSRATTGLVPDMSSASKSRHYGQGFNARLSLATTVNPRP